MKAHMKNLSVIRFQCLSSPVHMLIFMEILQTVIKKVYMKLEKQ